MNQPNQRREQIAPPTTHFGEVEVSFVLPCLNERETLAGCIQQARTAIDRLGLPGEIIVADNGSTDGSVDIARRMGACVVDVPVRGYGAALIYGCRAASGRFIVMGDSDASYDLLESLPMIHLLQEGSDIVIGSRMRGNILPGAMPWKNRYIGNPVLTGTLNFLFQAHVSDAHCGLRAFTRSAFDRMELRCTGMEFASEMIVKATLLDLKKAETPVTYWPDGRNRAPHLRPWRDGWRHLRLLLLYSPTWLYMLPGLLLLLVGLGLNTFLNLIPEATYITFGPIFFGTHWTVPATLAAAFGLQGIFLGMITLIYSAQRGLYPQPAWFSRISKHLSLERMLLAGLLVALVGLGIELNILIHWIMSGFGELTQFRMAMFGLMWILLGAETGFNSFILGLLANEVETLPVPGRSVHGPDRNSPD
jgi:glycosyltransferase involved in cell wall biosynthesis